MTGTVLILGANGRFGRHASEAFWNAGWRLRAFDRNTDDLMMAAKGCDVIVNAWNPPYTQWARDVPQQTRQVITAATAHDATVIVPGNVYVFGTAQEAWHAGSPHLATNPLGRIRKDMEAAYRTSGVRTILLRAGDFIDTQASGNWFDKVIAAKFDKGVITSPGDAGASHSWAYLPDLARAAVALAERREGFDRFEDIPYAGYTLSIDQMARLTSIATNQPVRVAPMAWWPLQLASSVWPMGRKLLEMRYLWSLPHRLEGSKFAGLVPDFPETDPVTALASALEFQIDPDQPMARRGAHLLAE